MFMVWCLLVVILSLGGAADSFAAPSDQGILQGIHGDRSIMPKSCRACHRGMAMRVSGEESTCLFCHGNSSDRGLMVSAGYLGRSGGYELANIDAELRKPYAHPVRTVEGAHRSFEKLPEEVVSAPRHSECVDCHDPHCVDRDAPFAGLPGKRVGNFIAEIDQEYQLCYKCHSESANLPARSTDKHVEFKTTNPSFHPVEGEGANAYVISLREPYAARKQNPADISQITCGSCHGNDDPAGPKGPHGSRFRGLLKANFEMEDGRAESETSYALCYDCHDRTSILGNESFAFHAQHIQGSGAGGEGGTSCFTCHDAHGSTRYQYLIRFNEDVVLPNADLKLEFKAQGVASRHGSCLLNCHGVEHNPKEY
jgi:hypothetical protein